MSDHGIVCERARTWATMQPDGELSGFEQRLLDAHLERCGPCHTFALGIQGATNAIRSAPLEALAHPVSVTRVARFAPRRLAPRRAIYSAVGAAAAAVLALSISSGVSVQPGDDAATAAPSPLVVITDGDDAADYQALRTYRRLQLATDIATPPSSRPHSFGVSGT